ncbi:hypothetical protein DENSPDRAFT_883822 [Dentipellis sp. KUC8613]|nr:hypothetical protein DENSPDRAFT_883822 [Dentipellis sp. KUC8613]
MTALAPLPARAIPPSAPAAIPRRPQVSRHRFVAELSQCLFDFVIQLLPTAEELAVKEDVRKLLERLIRTIEPDSRLLSFGSTANGFSLRNSDMDLCCLIDSEERLLAADLVTMLGDLLERETKFHVKPLPHARIPIVKLSLDPSPGLPLGIACDIGFENRLALENTRLLYCYAMIDPTRVRTLVLFLKVWCKRRKINSPYKGTLSSYGYVLLVIYFLVHVKNPPVLPNLQQMPPLRPISHEDSHIAGHNTWFFDDIELLRQRWQSANTESVGQLLTDFFKYFSRDFLYNTGVASIRAGLIKKDSKGWQNDLGEGRYKDARERNRFCIEDPFETDFNVARCVTRDGLYTIRGEFMRASRILAARPERAIVAIAQLCEERADNLNSPVSSTVAPVPPRLSPIPPQTPYTVGSSPMRTPEVQMPVPERLSPPVVQASNLQAGPSRTAPEHMEPKRSKWTSPPPPEAPLADHTSFEDRLGLGLVLATASTDAREQEAAYTSSSNNSDVLTDDDHLDELRSVGSVPDEFGATTARVRTMGASESVPSSSPLSPHVPSTFSSPDPGASTRFVGMNGGGISPIAVNRGRQWGRVPEASGVAAAPPPAVVIPRHVERLAQARVNSPRRSLSGPPATSLKIPNLNPMQSLLPLALTTPLPPSPADLSPSSQQRPHVLYETYGTKDHQHIPHYTRERGVQPHSQPLPHKLPQYLSSLQERPHISAPQAFAFSVPLVSNKRRSKALEPEGDTLPVPGVPSPTATPTSHTHFAVSDINNNNNNSNVNINDNTNISTNSNSNINSHTPAHAHTHSAATIVALTPPAGAHTALYPAHSHAHQYQHPHPQPRASTSTSTSRSHSPAPAFFPEDHPPALQPLRAASPHESASTTSAGSGSPAPSSTSSASPLSTSPSSPTHGGEFVQCAEGEGEGADEWRAHMDLRPRPHPHEHPPIDLADADADAKEGGPVVVQEMKVVDVEEAR